MSNFTEIGNFPSCVYFGFLSMVFVVRARSGPCASWEIHDTFATCVASDVMCVSLSALIK